MEKNHYKILIETSGLRTDGKNNRIGLFSALKEFVKENWQKRRESKNRRRRGGEARCGERGG